MEIPAPPDTECVIHPNKPNRDGYVQLCVRVNGVKKNVLAHRAAYARVHGEIPSHVALDHLCRVRACVNPTHLEPVTPGVNTLRGSTVSGINSRKTTCAEGHAFDKIADNRRSCSTCRRIKNATYRRERYRNDETFREKCKAETRRRKRAAS